MSLGDSSIFMIDHAPGCERCWTGGGRDTPGKKWGDWRKCECTNCHELTLASGDCLLFYGDSSAGVGHGTLAMYRGTAPPDLPEWCRGGRVSCQYRQGEIQQNFAECGAYS